MIWLVTYVRTCVVVTVSKVLSWWPSSNDTQGCNALYFIGIFIDFFHKWVKSSKNGGLREFIRKEKLSLRILHPIFIWFAPDYMVGLAFQIMPCKWTEWNTVYLLKKRFIFFQCCFFFKFVWMDVVIWDLVHNVETVFCCYTANIILKSRLKFEWRTEKELFQKLYPYSISCFQRPNTISTPYTKSKLKNVLSKLCSTFDRLRFNFLGTHQNWISKKITNCKRERHVKF